MTAESALSFFLAVLIFGITPGPGIFAILARALVNGAGSCVLLASGMILSDIVYLVAACLGLAAIATHWSELFTIIRILGAAYLLYLGYRMWTAPASPSDMTHSRVSRSDMATSFLQGFLISASNPKVILFYIAFLPTFMDLSVLGTGDIVLASALTVVALMLGVMSIAVFAARARGFFSSERAMKRLNRSAGAIMGSAGLYLVLRH
ncbi:LysE family translocator [Marinobacterium sediminicola]|uniref:Threonine/homoserine/homoserine lactone efflux protein n=1 Tax=Marinobacterium sediminicola TaxID=518898 RepID=A0ABY1RXS5_9GAMM|nr:LysE family translocator [Marinobacterium sediminicola]ULG67782.1 LysE family translocator [Marinobacterium sediminicola]SMR71544.1 Threonine/homoserine/homoserine lactone efflux protein [Marinobacterium sediminicola]